MREGNCRTPPSKPASDNCLELLAILDLQLVAKALRRFGPLERR